MRCVWCCCAAPDRLTKPTIAVLHGAAVGGGLAVPLCCDVAFATTDALFSIPEVRIGLMPGPLVPLFLRAMSYRAFRRYGLALGLTPHPCPLPI